MQFHSTVLRYKKGLKICLENIQQVELYTEELILLNFFLQRIRLLISLFIFLVDYRIIQLLLMEGIQKGD